MEVVRQTGRSLAADRSTKFLPIIVAQIFFIAAVAIALFRTTASAGDNAQGDTLYDKLQAHSIAFSAQYFWILPAVFLSSIIGVSQTEAAIPRILRRFQGDLDVVNLPEDHPGQPQRIQMPNDCLGDVQRRILRGGVYSWQPSSSTGSTSQPRPADNSHALLPYPVLLLGTVTGMLLSALVPPDGFNCRHAGEISMVTAWILSALADNILNRLWPLADAQPVGSNRSTIVLWVTIVKDFVMTFATMAGVVVMQIGIFNRCACYTRWGRVGLTLLERPDVAATLIHRLNTVYPAITFTSIGIELVIVPLYFCIRYCDALRVFIQRDDGQSNAPAWLRKACRKLQATQQRLLRLFPHLRFGPWKLKRIGTSRRASEEGRGPLAGGSHESHEMLRRTPSERQTHTPTGETRGAHETHGSASQITPVSETESSGAELLPPSETSSPPKPEPRRRKSEPQCSTDDDKPLPNLPPDDKLIHRKPVSTASPLQHAHRDS